MASGVLTLPALLLVKQHPEDNPVIALCKGLDPEENIKRAVDMIHNTSIVAEAYAVAEDLRLRANDSLNEIPDSEHKRALMELSDFVLARNI